MNAWASLKVLFASRRRIVLVALVCLMAGTVLAQAASADYTDDLPSVARVEAEIKGKDATDSLARQVAVFNYLYVYVDRIKSNRSYSGPYTPGEQRVMGAYRLASYQISQDYAKSHTADEAKAFERLHGQYEMDSDFYKDWSKRLIGPQSAAAYKGAEQGLAATQKAHVAQEQQQYQKDVAAQQAGAGGMSNDPTAVATRRCLELGGEAVACMGKGFAGGLLSMVTGGMDLGALTGPGRAGVVLSGTYGQGPAGVPFVTFSGDSATISNCGKLVADGHAYTLAKSGATLRANVANNPTPLVLTMRSDGSLAGPGMINIAGRIIIGYHTVTTTQMINGVRAAPDQCNGPCQTVTQVPDYANATANCSIGSLSAPSPPPASAADSDSSAMGSLLGAVTGMMGGADAVSLPGLRMEGKYSSSSGLILDFAGDAVTVDCGQAHIKAPYTVVNGATSLSVSVQNGGGPLTLTLAPNNTLSGSGSTTINGRLVSGMNGDTVTFTPHSESCAVGSLTPQNADSSSSVKSGPPAPVAVSAPMASGPVRTSTAVASPATMVPPAAASVSGMKLSVTSTFPTATNPLAGMPVKLMSDRFDNALRAIGAPIPAKATPGQALQAWAYNCNPPKDCTAPAQLMAKYYVGRGMFDSTGKVVLTAPVPPGTYYVFCSVAGTKGVLVWDMPIALKAGDNTINLTATDAEVIPIKVTQ